MSRRLGVRKGGRPSAPGVVLTNWPKKSRPPCQELRNPNQIAPHMAAQRIADGKKSFGFGKNDLNKAPNLLKSRALPRSIEFCATVFQKEGRFNGARPR